MSGGELAVVLAAVAVVVAAAVLGAVGVSISRSLRELRRLLGEIRRDVVPAVERIEEASGRVTGEVQRVGGLLDVAEAVSDRADRLSRVTYRALLEPFGAVAALFRRQGSTHPEAPPRPDPFVVGRSGGVASPPRPARQGSWMRRLTIYLLRSGYRSASARIIARSAAAQSQRATATATTTRTGGGAVRRSPDGAVDAAGGATQDAQLAGSGTAGGNVGGPSWDRELLSAVREVTEGVSTALEEARRNLGAQRRGEGRPE